MGSHRAPRLDFGCEARGGLHRTERCYAPFRVADRKSRQFQRRAPLILVILAIKSTARVPVEPQRRFSRCMNLAARAQPTGEFRPKWKRPVAIAIARLRFSLATWRGG